MGRILISVSHYDTICAAAMKYLEERGHEVVYDPSRPFPSYSAEELQVLLPDIDAAIIGMDAFDEAAFSAAPRLKAVAKFGVGVDNIDGEAAARRGVYVINAPGQNSCSVAELTAGLIVCLLRGIVPLNNAMTRGEWPRRIGTEVAGKTVGLVGFGAIARLLAERLRAFDAKVLAYDVFPDPKAAEALGVTLCPLEQVLAESDIVSLHVPGLPSTYHIINESSIASMKDGAYLVNTARGSLVDMDALAAALGSGKLSGAALDVFDTEPMPADAPIFSCGNVVCTPHVGGETLEAYERLAMSTAADVAAVLAGEEPRFCTNRALLKK